MFRIILKIFYNRFITLNICGKTYLMFINSVGHIIFLQNVEHNICRSGVPYYIAINFVEIQYIFNEISQLA